MGMIPLGPFPREPLFYGKLDSQISSSRILVWLSDLARMVNAFHLSGSATFAGAATVVVTFDHVELDANYQLAFGADSNETFWWSGKLTTGFTLHSSNAASIATVDYIVRRT